VPLDTAAAIADVDLDLDFSLGEDDTPAPARAPAPAARPAAAEPVRPAPAPVAELVPSLDLDFQSTGEPAEQNPSELTLGNDSLSFIPEPAKAPAPTPVAAARPPVPPAAAPASDAGMIEFDLGALSLDLEPPTAAAPATPTSAAPATGSASADAAGGDMSNDPLATKLALAQEFNAIGDPDGARSLAQEVLAEASGDLKSRAQRFLAEIS
jgi:pilus assembly protein FimV